MLEWEKASSENESKNAYVIPNSWLFIHYYEALTILFRIENVIRIFVYAVLKNKYKEDWINQSTESDDSDTGTIANISKKRANQAGEFGYLGYSVTSPIMHLTSGELTRLIFKDAYWTLFKEFFPGNKTIMQNKLEEIGSIRNSLAHFRPVSPDDVGVIKQNSNHVLKRIEQFVREMLNCFTTVPTNTNQEWYKELSVMFPNNFAFFQSKDEKWIRVQYTYLGSMLKMEGTGKQYKFIEAVGINSVNVINKYSKLKSLMIFASEQSALYIQDDGNPVLQKKLSFTFSKDSIENNHIDIKQDLENLVNDVRVEDELITKDNLAKGELLFPLSLVARFVKNDRYEYWTFNDSVWNTKLDTSGPSEYWESMGMFYGNYITDAQKYPWMATDISKSDMPF